MPDNFFTGIIF